MSALTPLAPPTPRGTPRAPAGVIAVSVAGVRRHPDHASELVNQLLHGETVRVLGATRDGRWLDTRSADGYRGWVRGWSVAVGPLARIRAWQAAARFRVRVPFWDAGTTGVGPLPFGARLARARGGQWWGPCGALGASAAAGRAVGRAVAPPRRGAGRAVVRAAAGWLGAPYLWGGRTAAGIDCSGLSQWATAAAGVGLPRDARLQCTALGGVRALRPLAEAVSQDSSAGPRPGDLWFFGPRRSEVTHVAISRGGLELIHAYGRVCHGSLDPEAGRFEAELFTSVLGWARLPRRGPARKFA